MPNGSLHSEPASGVNFNNQESVISLNNKRIDFFKTWSSKLGGHISVMSGKVHTESAEDDNSLCNTNKPLPVDLFFKTLEGPQLQTPKVCVYHLQV